MLSLSPRITFRRPVRATFALVTAPVLVLAGFAAATSGFAAARRSTAAPGVAPGKLSLMDCNGWSPRYKSFSFSLRMRCADPRGKIGTDPGPWVAADGKTYRDNGRFMDNGHYVGHDEPSVKFISSAPNSGNTFTYFVKLPVDPKRPLQPDGLVRGDRHLQPKIRANPEVNRKLGCKALRS